MYRVASLRVSSLRPAHGSGRAIKRAGELSGKHGAVRQLVKDGLPVDILIDPEKCHGLVADDRVKVLSVNGSHRLGFITREESAKAIRAGLAVSFSGRDDEVWLTPSAEFIPRVGSVREDMLDYAVSGGLCGPR